MSESLNTAFAEFAKAYTLSDRWFWVDPETGEMVVSKAPTGEQWVSIKFREPHASRDLASVNLMAGIRDYAKTAAGDVLYVRDPVEVCAGSQGYTASVRLLISGAT